SSRISYILEEVMVELEILIREKNASVQIINLPTQAIKCQPQRMKMLFYNLITNGIKFNTSDVPQINIDYEEREQDLYFSVSDNGIGIDEKYRNIIFKPFKRLNTRNNFPGNGIGLSICNRIVKIHGGNMHCKENEQNGTVFYFTFPKERPDTH
ncbi:MAG: ATP-binding protein, partial [Bacteroidota bacterium]